MSEARDEYYRELPYDEVIGNDYIARKYIRELEQQKAELINILKSIAKMKENDENELNRITKEIIDTIEKYK